MIIQTHNGLCANPEAFRKFMDANGKFKESLSEDIKALLSLYEASYLGANREDILSRAKDFIERHFKGSILQLSLKLCSCHCRSIEEGEQGLQCRRLQHQLGGHEG